MQEIQWTPEAVGRFWEWQSQHPEQYFTAQFGKQIAERLAPHLQGAQSVLDYGCGVGFLLPHLLSLGASVTGADSSPNSVAASNARAGKAANFKGAFLLDDLLKRNERFGAVLCIEVIEHLPDTVLAELFANVRRLLAPGGTAIFTTPNAENLKESEVYCAGCDSVFHRWQHVRTWTTQSLGDALQANGFAARSVYTTDFSTTVRSAPVVTLKRTVKRLLGRSVRYPHLVAVAS